MVSGADGPVLLSNNMVRVKLPMPSKNGRRPIVELVMEQNGRYQPIKFSNNMQVRVAFMHPPRFFVGIARH